jgi:hypothetical protein
VGAALSNCHVNAVNETPPKPGRQVTRRLAGIVCVVLGVYLLAYILNSYSGGYWLQLSRDGKDRFAPEFGGLSLTDAIMWQPRFGHYSLGSVDRLGFVFIIPIQIDQACFHKTHYLSDTNYKAWADQLHRSKVHPTFRDEFDRYNAKQGH